MPTNEVERENKSCKYELLYPKAVIVDDVADMRTKGFYANKFPVGACVHFTAGWNDHKPKDSLSSGLTKGYCYLTILADGTIVQNFDLARWGYHAGPSTWPGLGSGLSDKLVGIEICCGGRLSKKDGEYKTWFNKTVDADHRRSVKAEDNILNDGVYEMYTPEQEKALTEFLLWMNQAGKGVFKLDNVLGHDEIAPNRKNDPGGSLSMTMPKYREFLKAKAGEIVEKPIELPPSNPHLWNPEIFFNKMDNLLNNPTPERLADMRDIVWKSAKDKISKLLEK